MGASLATGNMGVTALGTSLAKLIREASPNAEITAFIGERSDETQKARVGGDEVVIRVINYRLSPRANIRHHLVGLFFGALSYRMFHCQALRKAILRWNPKLAALAQQDLIGNIWGGDSFTDLYGLRRVLEGAFASLIAIFLGRPFCLLPQTYGPYRSRIARALARAVIGRAKTVLCRDPEGPQELKALLGSRAEEKDIRFCPDVAFALEAKEPDPAAIEPPVDPSGGRPLVGFNVSGLLYNGGYSRDNMFGLSMDYREFVHRAAKKLLEVTDCDLLFLPHTFAAEDDVESDPYACRMVFQSLGGYTCRVHRLTGRYGPQVLKGAIGQCSFFIGSRMHACIAALSQGVPAVGVAYSDKFRGVFASVGVEHMILDARRETMDGALEKLLSLYQMAKALRSHLVARAERLRAQLAGEFERLLKDVAP